jgi:hypothetical protein
VNHQVEVTGRLDSSAGASATGSGSSSTPGSSSTGSGSTGSTAASQRLTVESVRMLASTCSR